MIFDCICVSDYQDRKYGIGKRVANPTRKSEGVARCTVCKTERKVGMVEDIINNLPKKGGKNVQKKGGK